MPKGLTTAVYVKSHADKGMTIITNQSCSHESCTKWPPFDVERSKTAL